MNLIVGGTGFVGGHLVEYLFQQGEISKGSFRKGAHLKVMDQNGVQGIEADLLDHASLHEAVEGVDTILNLASPMPGSGGEFERVNNEGVRNLLEVAVEMKVKALVHLSTLDVCGFGAGLVNEGTQPSPEGAYQEAKASSERLLLEFSKRTAQPRIVVIRAAKAVGPREPSFVTPLLKMVEGGKVRLPAGNEMSWSHPKDIAQAMLKAAMTPSISGRVFLVKSFDSDAESLATGVMAATGSKAEVRKDGLFSKSSIDPYASDQLKASLRIGDQQSWKDLTYNPAYNLRNTCEEIAAWYKKEPWVTEAA